MNEFDLIVIGAGPGGYVAAIKAAKKGLNTAVVENIRVGGTCLNRGCIPAKAMIHASSTYNEMLAEASDLGVYASDLKFDYGKIVDYKMQTTDKLVNGIETLLKGNGITLISGKGTLEKNNIVSVVNSEGERESYRADKIILATGSVPSLIPVPGIDLPGVLTSDGVFALEQVPESLVIIGGGVIGVEFASIFSNLGVKVTVIEALPRILQMMDKEISQNLKMILKKKGVEIHTGATLTSIEQEDSGLAVNYIEKDKEFSASAQYVVCAAGRKPNLDGLLGDGVEIKMDGRVIDTDWTKNFETSIKGVYAIGDIVRGTKLAHAASAHAIYCVEKMFGDTSSINMTAIPSGVYTDPEIAQVGLTEAEAKDIGMDVITGKFIMTANGKSVITREERGFIKVVIDDATHKVIGAQMMCARATDMIAEFTTAIVNELTAEQMLQAIRPHPTYNEGISEALEDALGESIHTIPRKRS